MKSRWTSRAGFSLIELAVVMLILAVVAGVAVPSIGRGIDALRARAEVAGISAFLRFAREQAVTRREVQEVRLDPAAHTLVLAAVGAERARMSRRFGQGLRVQAVAGSALSVKFFPEGLSTGATIMIEAPGRRYYIVTVDPLTGRVAQRRTDA